jgi:hypothetical protein
MSRGLPYLTPPEDSVRAGAWLLVDVDGVEKPLPRILPTWDYATDLVLRRQLDIDAHLIRETTELPSDAALGAAAVWNAGQHLRGVGQQEVIDPNETVTVRFDFRLTGRELGGSLTLDTRIYLAAALSSDGRPRVSHATSELWADSYRTRLEGQEARFPIALVDLAAHGFDPAAPWVLDVQRDLDGPATGAVYLLANEANPAVAHAVARADAPDPRSAALLSAMYYDAGRTLIEFALAQPELREGLEYEAETLGATLEALLRRVFPDTKVETIARRRDTDPAAYAGELAGALGLMADLPG